MNDKNLINGLYITLNQLKETGNIDDFKEVRNIIDVAEGYHKKGYPWLMDNVIDISKKLDIIKKRNNLICS